MDKNIPYGYCHCGCGNKTTLAKETSTRAGVHKGEPYRYLPNHYNHKGFRIKAGGYVKVKQVGHPRADSRGYVFEHILVAETKYGRLIGRNEHIHHLNEVKNDNRPENIAVLAKSAHHRVHTGKLALEKSGTHATPEGI